MIYRSIKKLKSVIYSPINRSRIVNWEDTTRNSIRPHTIKPRSKKIRIILKLIECKFLRNNPVWRVQISVLWAKYPPLQVRSTRNCLRIKTKWNIIVENLLQKVNPLTRITTLLSILKTQSALTQQILTCGILKKWIS